MKITKTKLKEMVRRVVRRKLSEMDDKKKKMQCGFDDDGEEEAKALFAIGEDLDPVGKNEKGRKVGVGQIRDIDNDGDVDDSDAYLALRRKKITKAVNDRKIKEEGVETYEAFPKDKCWSCGEDKPERNGKFDALCARCEKHEEKMDRDKLRSEGKKLKEEGYVESTTWGIVPSVEKLEELLGDEDFKMNLEGADSLAWDYATELSDKPMAGLYESADELFDSLHALVDVKSPDELTNDEYEEVEETLDRWNERYAGEDIAEHAGSLASSIVGVLGIEWI